MNLLLERITPENYAATLALSVAPDQTRLIAPVVRSLADAFVWGAEPRVARRGTDLVGFVMIFPFELAGEPVANVVRFMVDEHHQGQGIGRELMAATLGWVESRSPRPSRIRISSLPENTRALGLFRSCGFEGNDNDLEDGEVVLWKSV